MEEISLQLLYILQITTHREWLGALLILESPINHLSFEVLVDYVKFE
jgi:hypothetical protein